MSRFKRAKVIVEIPSDEEKAGYNVVKKSVFSTRKIEQLGWKIDSSMYKKNARYIDRMQIDDTLKYL